MALPKRRKVGLFAPFRWLKKGWRDLWAVPDISMAYGALFAAIGAFITFFSLNTPQLTLNFWSGFLLVGPLLAIGLYRIAQLREVGDRIRLTRCIKVLGERRGEVALYVLFLGLLMIGWILFSGLMVAMFFGDIPPEADAFENALFSADGVRFLAVLFGVGAIFACIVFASSAISLPMVLDGRADIITAVVTSIKTVMDQPLTMILWAALVATLTIFGMATLFLGFVVIFPVLGYATWHSYRDLVE
jgi:uncharacterized membrane protein